MAIPVDSTQVQKGDTEYVLAAAGSTSAISNGSIVQCSQDNLLVADVDGAEFAIFEFDTGGTFSAAPTAGAVINVYERRFNSDGNQGPVVDANHKHHFIGSFNVDPADVAQYFVDVFPINFYGGDYYAEWKDGGAGTAQVSAGWELRAWPIATGLNAS